MNTCAQFEEALIAAASGEATTDARAALDAHLQGCGGCRKQFVDERRLFAMVDAGLMRMVAGEPSPEFAANVMAQVTGAAERALQAQIDAGLAATVATEPSPQFAAAVRARIATEPAPRRAWFAWYWWAPAAGAVAAAALAVVLWQKPAQPNHPLNAKDNNVADTAKSTAGALVTAIPRNTDRKPRRPRDPGTVTLVPTVAATDFPEVLIIPEERRGVGFYAAQQQQRMKTVRLLAERLDTASLLGEMQTGILVLRGAEMKTLDLVDSPRSTSDISNKE